MTVFRQIPEDAYQRMHVLLRTIGYWGQSSSFASCMAISRTLPRLGVCAIPLNLVDDTVPLRHYFTCLVTEFRSNQVSWYDVVPGNVRPKTSALRLDHYLWPMIIEYRHGTAKLLVRTPLFEGEK